MPRSFILPGQPTRYTRDRVFNIDHTRLELSLDFDEKTISGKVTHKISPVGRKISSVELDAAELSISSIKVNGKEVSTYETRPRSILIRLGFELGLNDEAELQIEYSARPRRGLYFRGPNKDFPDWKVHAFTQGQSEDAKFWFPCYDNPNMRTKTETKVTVPSNMVVVSNGKLASGPIEKEGKKTWHFVQEIPHAAYLLSIVAGDFEDSKETHNGIVLEYVYPKGKDEEAKRSFGKTAEMIDYFSEITGLKYPYPKYSQSAVSDFMFGGMENITATTLTDRTLHDARSHLDFTSDYLVAHELAHQWFGDLMTCKDWSHAWLNEGFATYCTSLWVEHDSGVDEFQYYMYIPTYQNLVEELDRYHRAIVTKRYWDADELFDRHTYEKGAWVLNGLRGLLGDDLFFKGIKKYVAEHQNRVVETSDFRKALESVSGLDLEYFFDQWVYSPGFPEYNVSYNWDSENKLAELEVEQTNAGVDEIPLYTSPVKVRFTFDDGHKVTKNIRMKEKKESLFFPFDKAPANVNFDPQNSMLKKLKFSKPKEMHIYQLKNDDNSMERIRAAGELGSSFPDDDVVQALAESVDKDKFWAVQLEAGKAIGKIGSKKALESLLARTSHKDHRTRRGIAFGLRGFTGLKDAEREKAIDSLIQILESDEAYYARGYAAWSLGFYKDSDKAFDALKRAVSQESINDMVRYRVFQGYYEMNDPRAIPIAIDYMDHGKWHQGRGLAAYCLGKIGKGNPEATQALLDAERIPNIYVRDEAAAALGMLGDTSIIPKLEAWLSREPEGRARRRLREAIFLLKEKALEANGVSKVGSDVARIEDQLKKTDSKVSSLEALVKNREHLASA
jgi:aminopeptidase N